MRASHDVCMGRSASIRMHLSGFNRSGALVRKRSPFLFANPGCGTFREGRRCLIDKQKEKENAKGYRALGDGRPDPGDHPALHVRLLTAIAGDFRLRSSRTRSSAFMDRAFAPHSGSTFLYHCGEMDSSLPLRSCAGHTAPVERARGRDAPHCISQVRTRQPCGNETRGELQVTSC